MIAFFIRSFDVNSESDSEADRRILRQFWKLGYLEKGRSEQEDKGWRKERRASSMKLEIPDKDQDPPLTRFTYTHVLSNLVDNLASDFSGYVCSVQRHAVTAR